MPNCKLKYEDSENIKADSVNRVVFNLNQTSGVSFRTPGRSRTRAKSFEEEAKKR